MRLPYTLPKSTPLIKSEIGRIGGHKTRACAYARGKSMFIITICRLFNRCAWCYWKNYCGYRVAHGRCWRVGPDGWERR
ncbi:MAG: hypothetical protein ABFD76_06750 [Smithella sp.]